MDPMEPNAKKHGAKYFNQNIFYKSQKGLSYIFLKNPLILAIYGRGLLEKSCINSLEITTDFTVYNLELRFSDILLTLYNS